MANRKEIVSSPVRASESLKPHSDTNPFYTEDGILTATRSIGTRGTTQRHPQNGAENHVP